MTYGAIYNGLPNTYLNLLFLNFEMNPHNPKSIIFKKLEELYSNIIF